MHWIPLLLGLIILTFTIKYLINNVSLVHSLLYVNEPICQSDFIKTVIYNSTGKINCKLIADHIEFFNEKRISWFIQLSATTFNENTEPTWSAKADRGKLVNNKMLYLYGHVQIVSLKNTSQIQKIVTESAVINLVTHDIFSNNSITLCGQDFISSGMRMCGNLNKKTIKLIEKVKTSYNRKNVQCKFSSTK
ncbi:LPS export ABC transporter periplasmic protein LptC [Sodalis sp. CWE]|uniref:LPS export ABC transporter periplasmic protein LptC n=1 Tax=Sodalis sp. CWE TaxID=2803816 RepID=UPI001C7D2618|nr:LPS export ABC transporter periplasmic protein LptC [Sodalis sp. CWE]MBX4180846.1 LPS export ABC transporter periplasmic protein LptC [Sodalis sp. CWE]